MVDRHKCLMAWLARHIQHLRQKTISPRVVDLVCSSYHRQVFFYRIPTSPHAECVWSPVKMGRTVLQLTKLPLALFRIRKTNLLIPEHFLCEGMLQHSSPAVAVAWNRHGSRSELPPRKAKLLKQILTKLLIVTGGAEINLSFQGNQVKKV